MKKIVTVSVLAIMAVSAARADIASTSYVDKTAAGAVTTGLGAEGNITKAIATATNDMATKTKVAQDIATAVTDMATQTWVTTNATAAQAKADSEGQVITATYATKEELNKVAGGELTIQPGAVGTTELEDGSVTDAKLGTDVKGKYATKSELPTAVSQLTNDSKFQTESEVSSAIATATTDMAKTSDIGKGTLTVTIDGANAGTFNANAADNGTIAITVPATYVNETELGSALDPYAKSADVAGTYATKQALTDGLAEKVNTADVANLSVSHATTADSATKATQDGAGKVITETYATKTEAAGYIDPTELNNKLADYSTTAQMNTELAKKLDDTAKGSATLPIYIDENGVSQTITSYEGKAATAGAADTATTATNYNETSGTIKTKFDGVDTSLAKVAAFGEVPAVPADCVAGTADCTLVIAYTAEKGMTHTWEKIAR